MMIYDVTNYVVFLSSLKHAVDLKRQILLLIYSKKGISLPNPFESAEHSLKEGVFLPCKCCRIASKAVLFCKAMYIMKSDFEPLANLPNRVSRNENSCPKINM